MFVWSYFAIIDLYYVDRANCSVSCAIIIIIHGSKR